MGDITIKFGVVAAIMARGDEAGVDGTCGEVVCYCDVSAGVWLPVSANGEGATFINHLWISLNSRSLNDTTDNVVVNSYIS